jgi:Ca-activated chloride channel homolog
MFAVFRVVIFCFLLCGFVMLTAAQGPHADSNSTLITVTVVDDHGRWITGLEKSNFSIVEHKQTKIIRSFEKKSDPLSIGIVIDKSGSANSTGYEKISIPLTLFLERASPKNEYFLMAFNDSQQYLTDWTDDLASVKSEVNSLATISPKKKTKFFDALSSALDRFGASRYPRKVLLVISDGEDNRSELTFAWLKERFKRSDVMVYVVAPPRSGDLIMGFSGQAFLDNLVELTGGKSFYPALNELNQVLFRIAEELDYQYLITIDKSALDEKWHDLDIQVTMPAEMKKLGKPTIRARRGYYASQLKQAERS